MGKTHMASPARIAKKIRPRVKVWLDLQGEHVFCAGMCAILEAIEQTGSIKEGAALVGRSYRHIWTRLKEVEQALGHPLVDAHVGGKTLRRTDLSPAGKSLLALFRNLREQMQAASDDFAREFKVELSRISAGGS